jgi:glycine cleavage system H protein
VSNIPPDLLYTPEHEYVRKTADPGVVEIGITDYAQGELGDVVFVELPKPSATFDRMGVFGTGEVTEANAVLETDPAAINRDPYGAGWMIKIRLRDPSELGSLLTAAQYQEKIGG